MKTVVIVSLLLLVPGMAFADSSGWLIPWSEDSLKISDFKGSEKPLAENIKRSYDPVAFINTMIDGTWNIERVDSDQCKYHITDHNMQAYFLPYSSWATQEAIETDGFLNHDQRHFDISQIYANQFNNDNKEYPCPNGLYDTKQIDYEIQKKLKQTKEDMQKTQDLYDLETRGGTYKMQQAKWNDKIEQWLDTGIEPLNEPWTDNLFFWMESSQITNQEFLFALEYLIEKEILD